MIGRLIVILLGILLLGGCGSQFEENRTERIAEVEAIAEGLPMAPGSILLNQINEFDGKGRIPGCGTVEISKLFGTNNLTFEEAVKWYSNNPDPTFWTNDGLGGTGVGYTHDGHFFLSVDDNYVWYPSMDDLVKEEQGNYQTFYLVTISAYVTPNTTPADCS